MFINIAACAPRCFFMPDMESVLTVTPTRDASRPSPGG